MGHRGLDVLVELTTQQHVRMPSAQLPAPRAHSFSPLSRAAVSRCAHVPHTPGQGLRCSQVFWWWQPGRWVILSVLLHHPLWVRPSAPSSKLMPTAPPDKRTPVLRQAAGALPSSSTCCRASTLTHRQGLQGQATSTLNTLLGGVLEELLAMLPELPKVAVAIPGLPSVP